MQDQEERINRVIAKYSVPYQVIKYRLETGVNYLQDQVDDEGNIISDVCTGMPEQQVCPDFDFLPMAFSCFPPLVQFLALLASFDKPPVVFTETTVTVAKTLFPHTRTCPSGALSHLAEKMHFDSLTRRRFADALDESEALPQKIIRKEVNDDSVAPPVKVKVTTGAALNEMFLKYALV